MWPLFLTRMQALSETYLLHAVASLHLSDVQSILDSLDTQEKAVYYPTLLPAAKARKSSLDQPIDHVQLEDPTPHPDTSGTAWRELVEAAVEVIIDPDFVAWMHDDNSFSDMQFAKRALNDVKARYIECVEPVCPLMTSLIGTLQEAALQHRRDWTRGGREGTEQTTLPPRAWRFPRLSIIHQQTGDQQP